LLNATIILIILNIIMFFIQNSIEYGTAILGLNRLFIEGGLLYQPLSSMFAHGSIAHIVMNMIVLFQFGSLIEQVRGTKFFLSLYLIGGLLTSLFSFLFIYLLDLNHNLVGASGAISVLIGWIAIKDSYNRKGLVIMMLLISFAPLLLGMNIAWYAHIIGFIIGFLFGFIKR